MRLAFEDDVVLVQLGVHGVDLALAEGVVEGVVDGGGSDAEAGGGGAVDDERDGETAGLFVGGDVFKVGQILKASDEAIGPVAEFVGVGVFEGELILSAADTVVDGDVLHGLHEELDALDVL